MLILSGDHLYRMDYMDFVQVTTHYNIYAVAAVLYTSIISPALTRLFLRIVM